MKRLAERLTFDFAGKNSEDMGVRLLSQPTIEQPVMRGTKNTLPGRHGFMYTADGGYGEIKVKVDLAVPDPDEYLADALNWLRGSGDLVFSNDEDYAYEASVITAFNRTPITKRLDGQKMTVTFTCQPFRHLVREKPIVLTEAKIFKGQGHVASLPLLKVEGSGSESLMVNDQTMLLTLNSGTPLFIDCDAGTAYAEGESDLVFAGGQVTLVDDWFQLRPQGKTQNAVNFTSGISQVTIYPRWRWI